MNSIIIGMPFMTNCMCTWLLVVWSIFNTHLSLDVGRIGNCTSVQVAKLLEERYCQPPPPGCPRAVYAIMVDCW